MFRLRYLFILGTFFKNVALLALEGPELTSYDPCGLGVIHFDKLQNNLWRGNVNFGLSNSDVRIEIFFEEPVVVYPLINSSKFHTLRSSVRHLLVTHVGPVFNFDSYSFDVELNNGPDFPFVAQFVMNNVTLCRNYVEENESVFQERIPKISYNGTSYICGRRFLNHTEMVSTNTMAAAGEWPWHAAMFVMNPDTGLAEYRCGGTVISHTAVLTAGHCVYMENKLLETNKVLIIVGSVNYTEPVEIGRQQFTATEIVLHPEFNEYKATSDLAVIKVRRILFTEFVQPICIWGPTYDKSKIFGMEAIIVGFGETEDNRLSPVLRSSNTMVQSDETCINFSPNTYKKLMNEFTFCAGYGPTFAKNPRNGDSGGGLVIRTIQLDQRITWFLRGVLARCGLSRGQAACDPTRYVVYTDVAPHYGWIIHHAGLDFSVNLL